MWSYRSHMVTLSKKCIYGVQAVYELALAGKGRSVTIGQISKNQNIPEDYLRQLLIHLKKSGIVESVRGTQGGYIISASPSKIKIRDIIESIEGEIKFVNADTKDSVLTWLWNKINSEAKTIFNISIEELVKEKAKMQNIVDYHI